MQFASVRLDEEWTRCQPCHQRRAAHIQHKQAFRQGEHQVAVILRRTFRRQRPRQDDILPRNCLFRQQVRKRPRSLIRAQYGARIARSVTIQYGGSMNPANAAELLGHEDIDGGLIGGASLDAGKFMDIVNAANQG